MCIASKGQRLLWYIAAKMASRGHCFRWINTESCTNFSVTILYLPMCSGITFSCFRAPHKVLWLMGTHWYAPPHWLPFRQAKGSRLIRLSIFSPTLFYLFISAGVYVYWDRRKDAFVLQWIKTCSLYLYNYSLPHDEWYLTSMSSKLLPFGCKSWFNERVTWIDKQIWQRGLLGGELNGRWMMCSLLSVM